MESTGPNKLTPPITTAMLEEPKSKEEKVTKQIPEPGERPESKVYSTEQISPTVRPSLAGLQAMQKMSAVDLLKVVFDQNTLNGWADYHQSEPGKANSLVNTWLLLIDRVKERQFLDPSKLKDLVSELHAVSLAHAKGYLSAFQSDFHSPGEFRHEFLARKERSFRGSHLYAPLVQKDNSMPCSEEYLRESASIWKELCETAGLPELEPYCFREASKGSFLFFAVPLEHAVKLLSSPPNDLDEADQLFRDIADHWTIDQSTLEKYKFVGQHQQEMVFSWMSVKKTCGPEASEEVRQNHKRILKALIRTGHSLVDEKVGFLRQNIIDNEHIEPLLKQWFEETSRTFNAIKTESDLTNALIFSMKRFHRIRFFPDGNARVGGLLMQGVRMTFGLPPLKLKSRYFWSAEKAVQKEILTSVLHEQDLFIPSRAQLKCINPLVEKLKSLSLQDAGQDGVVDSKLTTSPKNEH